MAQSIYRQLTGKRRKLHMFTQLFLGPDHLLLVLSSRFEERYQRFYFKDIQALVVTGLPSRTWLQASLGVLAGTAFLLALTVVPIAGWRALLGMIGVIPTAIALTDYLRGERCSMILKTAVSNEPLPPVSRMSVARLVISRLKPAIEQTQQGGWTAEMTPASGTPVLAPRPVQLPSASRLVPAVFGLVTLDAVIYVAARLTRRNEILFLLLYTVFTEIVLAMAALRRRGDDPRWILFSLSGVIAACAALDVLGGIGLFGYLFFTAATTRAPSLNYEQFMIQPYPQIMMWWGCGWRAVVAAAGWAAYFIRIERAGESPSGSPSGGPASLQ